jgi:hypothetical protein
MTFEAITSFLKRFHLTLCSHLPSTRDEGNWKLPEGAFLSYIHEKREQGLMTEDEARDALNPPNYDDIKVPTKIKIVPHFKDNVFFVGTAFDAPTPFSRYFMVSEMPPEKDSEA